MTDAAFARQTPRQTRKNAEDRETTTRREPRRASEGRTGNKGVDTSMFLSYELLSAHDNVTLDPLGRLAILHLAGKLAIWILALG